MYHLLAAFQATAEAGTQPEGLMGFLISNSYILIPLVLVVVMFWFQSRSQKKQEKKAAELRDNIDIGDEVISVGGIVGRVVSVKEDTFVMETGSDRTRVRFQRSAIKEVNRLEIETPDKNKDKEKGKSKNDSSDKKDKETEKKDKEPAKKEGFFKNAK